MAQRGEDLNTRLTADDQASAVVDKLADKVADLEDTEHEVDLGADDSKVDQELRALDRRLQDLTDDEKVVVLNLAAEKAEREIRNLNRRLADAERYDNKTIDMFVEAKGNAERKLEAIKDDIRQIDGATPDIRPEVDSSELDDLLGKLGELSGFGGAFGAAGPVAAVGAVLGAAVTQARDVGTEVRTIATVLETSVEEASRLRAVFADTGIEANDLQDIGLQVAGALSDNADLAERLRITIGQAQNPAEALKAAIDGWDFLSATERSALFGEEGVRQIGQIIARGEDLESLLAGIDGGRIMSDADIERVGRLNEIVADFNGGLEEMTLQIGGPLVDAIGRLEQALDFGPGSDNETGIVKSITDALDFAVNGSVGGLPNPGEVLSDRLFGPDEDYERKKNLIEETINAAAGSADGAGSSLRGAADDADEFASAAENAGVKAAAALRTAEDRFGGVNDEMGGAMLRAEEWGASIVDAADKAGGALDGISEKLAGLLGRVSEKGAVNDIADQWDRLVEAQGEYWAAEQDESKNAEKEKRAYEEQLARLLEQVLRFSEEVGDIPEEKLIKLAAAIDEGNFAAVKTALDELFADRQVGVTFGSGGGPNWRLDEDGKPVPVDDGSSAQTFDREGVRSEAVFIDQRQITYAIEPTPSQIGTGTRENDLWNGERRR